MTVFAGDEVNAEDINDAAGVVVVGTAEPTNNTAGLITDLILTLPKAGKWAIWGTYLFKSSSAAGLKVNIAGDGAGVPHANVRWGVEGNTAMNFGNTSMGISVSGASSFYRAALWATADSTAAGTVVVQYAQTTAGAGPTGPIANRWLRAHLIP